MLSTFSRSNCKSSVINKNKRRLNNRCLKRDKVMNKSWKLILGLSAILATNNAFAYQEPSSNNSKLKLEACHLEGIKTQVKCGTLEVPENYSELDGKTLSINFAILPAIDSSTYKEPLMFLAGGPGQAAVELAAQIRRSYTEIRKTRDIILVDQRGTGKSHPLQCEDAVEMNAYELIPEDFNKKEVETCLASFNENLSQFTSENAVRDFDEVRKALGHEQINIYGGSYGTRAGLVYLKLFPNSIKNAVLDSVGPIEVPIGTFGLSAERSFNKLKENCQASESCQKAYPNLAEEFQQLAARLEKTPKEVTIAHPRLGTPTKFVITKSKLIANIRMQLYSMQTRSMVPLIIHQAYLNNYSPLAGIIAQADGGMSMYIGLTFNIVCNEDFPRVTAQMLTEDADNKFGQANSHMSFSMACPMWPTYEVADAFYQPVTANVPTLILSGDLDPVTPPSNGEYPEKTLPNSRHIISENNAHIVASTTCAIKLINEFLTKGSSDDLDDSCLAELPKPSFMTSLNGSL